MATYKVIQDVEAEDKILGPLTLRQFIYGGIAVICLYLSYFVSTHSAAFLMVMFLPVALVTGFFAFPWGRDQPTEVWALAKVRFFLKPRRRIWDQSGIKELVTVTAPKKIEGNYTNGLSQTEVRSRLHALADTIDSRGWAVKNANISMLTQPMTAQVSSDRLVEASTLPQPIVTVDVQASDDILDEKNNRVAKNMENMIEASAKAHHDQLIASLRPGTPAAAQPPAHPAQPANNYWFLNQPSQPAAIPSNMVTFNTQVVEPGMEEAEFPASAPAPATPTMDEKALVQELEAHKHDMPTASYYGHLHMVQPLSAQHAVPSQAVVPPVQIATPPVVGTTQAPPPALPQQMSPVSTTPPPAQVTPTQQAAILQLANNDDLNVATIAREAKRSEDQEEVVINLH